MVWWSIAIFWIGGCLAILLAALVNWARHGDDLEKQSPSRTPELPVGGDQATPDA